MEPGIQKRHDCRKETASGSIGVRWESWQHGALLVTGRGLAKALIAWGRKPAAELEQVRHNWRCRNSRGEQGARHGCSGAEATWNRMVLP